MEQNNGYFYLVRKNDGVYMKLYPATSDGRNVTLEAVMEYLVAVKIKDYDMEALHKAVSCLTEECEVKICSKAIPFSIPEMMKIYVTEDRMAAFCKFYPASDLGSVLLEEEIRSELIKENIKYGLIEGTIADIVRKKAYNTDLLIAKGLQPVNGKNAEIIYYFQTDRTLKPKHNDDGSVDFHQLDMISHVNKDQLIAELKPANLGTPGIDVNGNVIRPLKVVNKILRHGGNIYLSEDGLKMYSKVSGHVELTDDKVFVSDTFEVLADVDTSTGDINYDGNVHVKGNVRTGFSIRAKGDIIVEGVVEGAELYSDGQIILKRGIQGMNRGLLQAKGNVLSKFIESSTIKAGGYVDTEAVLHSKIYARSDVIVSGKKGFVTGGEIKAGSMIQLKTAGSTMGTNTVLEVGVDPAMLEEYHEYESKIAKLQEEKEKIIQILTVYKRKVMTGEKLGTETLQYLQKLSQQNSLIDAEMAPALEKYEVLQKEVEGDINGVIIVENKAYPGVRISIGSCIYIVKNVEHHCKFIKDNVDVKVVGLL